MAPLRLNTSATVRLIGKALHAMKRSKAGNVQMIDVLNPNTVPVTIWLDRNFQ